MTMFAGLSLRMPYHRQISLVIDLVIDRGVFLDRREGMNGPVLWAGLLPILIGAIYFEWWGALLAAALFSCLEVASIMDWGCFSAFITDHHCCCCQYNGAWACCLGLSATSCYRIYGKCMLRASMKNNDACRMENERWRALYELTSTLTGTLSYRRVLDSVLDLGYIVLNPDPDANETKN